MREHAEEARLAAEGRWSVTSTEIVLGVLLVMSMAGTQWALNRVIHLCKLNLELLRSYRDEDGEA